MPPSYDDDEPIPTMVPLPEPRPLAEKERGIVEFLVEPPYGSEALLAQARVAQAVAECSCGCPSILLDVPASAPREAATDRRPGTPGDLTAYQVLSRGYGAQVTVHVVDGALWELEIWGHGYGHRPRIDPAKLKRVQEIDWNA